MNRSRVASQWWSLGAILAAGAAIRILVALPPNLDWDESWVGTSALYVLKGFFPPFFYGQPFMGSAESYLHAVVLAVTGASPWSLKVWPVVLGVVFIYGCFRVAACLFDREAAYAAAVAASLPAPFFVKWSVNARLHYSMTPFLGVLLVFVAFRIMAGPDRHRPLRWLLLGVLSGLTFWNFYGGVVYPAAVAGLLLATRPRETLRWGTVLGIPGFFLGSLPLWLYNLRVRVLFLSPPGRWAAWRDAPARVFEVLTHNLPTVLGMPRPPHLAAGWIVQALLTGGALVLGLAATGYQAVRRDPRAAVVPIVFVGVIALVSVRMYATWVEDHYLLPVFTVVPLLAAAAFSVIARWSRGAAWGLLGLLVLLNAWASLDSHSVVGQPDRVPSFDARGRNEAALFETLRDQGLTHVYGLDWGTQPLNFNREGVTFAWPYDDLVPRVGLLADAATRVAFVGRQRDPSLEAGLAALGATYRIERPGSWWVYKDIQLPPAGYEEIPPDGWRATADENLHLAAYALDRDADTMWSNVAGQRPGLWFMLDLGRVQPVAMVSWLPSAFHQTPGGIEVAVSVDGATWRTVSEVPWYGQPVYWSGPHPFLRLRRARVELRFAPAEARFLRLTQPGLEPDHAWTMRELFVYGPAAAASPFDPAEIDRLAGELLARGVSRVYADHWVLARLALASRGALPILPINTYIDNHGWSDLNRRWRPWRVNVTQAHFHEAREDYELLDRFRLRRTTAVVLERSTGAPASFERAMLEAGYAYAREERGSYLLYSRFAAPAFPTRPIARTGWRVSASIAAERAGLALDGDPSTRWTTVGTATQAPGQWFTVDMGRPTAVGAVTLDLGDSSEEYPRGLALAVSNDGSHWTPLATELVRSGQLAWEGTHALRRGVGRLLVRFPSATAQFLRLTQAGADPVHGWSIHELEAYGPEAGLAR